MSIGAIIGWWIVVSIATAAVTAMLVRNAPESDLEDERDEAFDRIITEKMTQRRKEKENKINRINDLIMLAAHHREQMEAIRKEFVQLHDYTMQSTEGRELTDVIWFGEDYPEAIDRIMTLKKLKQKRDPK